MNEAAEEKLYGLIEIAERQQDAAQMALEGLAAERMALGQEREQWVNEISLLNEDIRSAVQKAVSESMAKAAGTGAEVAKGVTEPLLGMLAGVSAQAGQAEAALRDVVRWASWRLLGWGLAMMAGLTLLWWLASCAVLWWDTSAIGAAQVQKAQLQAEIAELQARHDVWVETGALGKTDRCGHKKRLCIRVDESAGAFGDQSDYRVIQGY